MISINAFYSLIKCPIFLLQIFDIDKTHNSRYSEVEIQIAFNKKQFTHHFIKISLKYQA